MHTFLTPEPITIEIRNASGDIRIDLADVASTTVDVVASTSHPLGFLDDVIRAAKNQFAGAGGRSRPASSFEETSSEPMEDPVERVRVDLRTPAEGQGAATLIVDTDPARNGWKSSFTVHVTAPQHSGIRLQSQSADVSITGPAGRLEVRTAAGEVRVDDVDQASVVQTASGNIDLRSTGHCDLRSASGDIRVRQVAGDAVVHSTSGSVQLDVAGGNVNARSVSGRITVGDATAGRLELVTVSGDVVIGIHAGSLAAIDLSTVSGRTETDLPVSDSAPVEEDGQDGPQLELKARTTSGDIRVRRAAAAA